MLSTVAKHYKEKGFYIARQILPLDALEKTNYEMDVVLVQQLNKLGCAEKASATIDVLHEHMRMLHGLNQNAYLQSIRLWAKLFSMHALIMHPTMVEVAHSLGITLPIFQTTPVVHVMANDLKITGGYHGVGVHQDWPALQSGLDTITVWFPFMDVDKNNYPVEVIPGSHVNGLYPGAAADNIYEVDAASYDEKAFVPMEANLGDVLFFSNFMLHRSCLNGDHRLRVACSARYENASERTFIERCYPTAQKRVIERQLIDPDFPQPGDVKALFQGD